MLQNYLTIAWRNFIRHKTFSLINLLGLTIGMTACLLIVEYVQHEKGYDRFHQNRADLYRVAQNRYNNGELSTEWAAGAGAAATALKETYPEVKHSINIRSVRGTMSYEDQSFREEKMFLVMPAFFEMFSFEMLQGNPTEAFEKPNQAVVSKSTAKKYFGEADPIGKTVRLNQDDIFTIVGVFADVPEQSHMKFDWLFSFQTYLGWVGEEVLTAWQWDGFYTYVQLQEGTDPKTLEAKLPDLIETRAGEQLREYNSWMSFYLQPVTDIHLTSDLMMEMEANGNGQYVHFLWIIACFILFIAWVNYINLSTAKSAERAREVGIRKVMGSHRAGLMRQFLAESFFTNLAAAVLSVGLSYVLLPLFNQLTGQELTLSLFGSPVFWLMVLVVLLLGALLSGLYPAIILSSFEPVKVLKGRFSGSAKGILLRKLLVGFQFGISLLLIAGTLTVYRQLNYMRSQDLGVNIDQTLVLKAPNITDSTYQEKVTALKTEMARPASIQYVSTSTAVPGRKPPWNAGGIRRVGEPPSAGNQYRVIGMDYDFVDAFGLEIKEGRSFDRSYGTDEGTVMFNESAVKLMGFDNEEEAIGTDIFFWGDTFQIIGVLADYHQQSLKEAPDPLVFRLIPSSRSFFSVKIQAGENGSNVSEALAHVEQSWNQFFPGSPMEYFFLDDYFNEQYKNDRLFGRAFASFALLAILVACMGLFGLTAYSAIQRTKEVGIRKVMGASESEIIQLLTKEVLWLMGIAALIALPLAGFLMNHWLNGYAFRIELDWTLFALPMLFLLAITFLTVSFQTIRTARTNPIRALRYE